VRKKNLNQRLHSRVKLMRTAKLEQMIAITHVNVMMMTVEVDETAVVDSATATVAEAKTRLSPKCLRTTSLFL
jgi:hypothetical protein